MNFVLDSWGNHCLSLSTYHNRQQLLCAVCLAILRRDLCCGDSVHHTNHDVSIALFMVCVCLFVHQCRLGPTYVLLVYILLENFKHYLLGFLYQVSGFCLLLMMSFSILPKIEFDFYCVPFSLCQGISLSLSLWTSHPTTLSSFAFTSL